MIRNDIREIQTGDIFDCERASGRYYIGRVKSVRVVKGNRETLVTIDLGHDEDGATVYRAVYPCDCVSWSAHTPEAGE